MFTKAERQFLRNRQVKVESTDIDGQPMAEDNYRVTMGGMTIGYVMSADNYWWARGEQEQFKMVTTLFDAVVTVYAVNF